MIRQPEFVTEDVFKWACSEVLKKKPQVDVSKARFQTFKEGLCVQIMHVGSYNEEPKSVEKIDEYIKDNGFKNDISSLNECGKVRRHHEIYISDPRKTKSTSLKTVIRTPVVKLKN